MIRKLGIYAILLGLAVPIISFCFTSYYNPYKGFFGSLPQMQIVLNEGRGIYHDGLLYIPYNVILAAGLALIFIGVGLFFSQKKKSGA